jgi:hypothetical protein
MRFIIRPESQVLRDSSRAIVVASVLLGSGLILVQFTSTTSLAQAPKPQAAQSSVQHGHRSSKKHKAAKPEPAPSAPAAPAAPPMPSWPVNDNPQPAAVTWDSHGLRVDASNSSLQQILNDVSTETGTKVEGFGSDQRVYGSYGPGQARDVISQLLAGSGYNVLLAGDLGSGAPRQVMLTPRHAERAAQGSPGAEQQENNNDEDAPDNEVDEQPPPPPPPQAPVQMQPNPGQGNPGIGRPGFGPNGPIRTPQQVMEEMQRQQQLQQQQQQQQQGGAQPDNQ